MILCATPEACQTFLKFLATSKYSVSLRGYWHISPLYAVSTCSEIILGIFTSLVQLRKLANGLKTREQMDQQTDWHTDKQCDWTFFLCMKSGKRCSLFTKDIIKLLRRKNSSRRLFILKTSEKKLCVNLWMQSGENCV